MTLMYFTTFFFFFNDTATTEIYTLSLHDALPILFAPSYSSLRPTFSETMPSSITSVSFAAYSIRSEEHTSELQSQFHLVCRLLLEKKKKQTHTRTNIQSKNVLLKPITLTSSNRHC